MNRKLRLLGVALAVPGAIVPFLPLGGTGHSPIEVLLTERFDPLYAAYLLAMPIAVWQLRCLLPRPVHKAETAALLLISALAVGFYVWTTFAMLEPGSGAFFVLGPWFTLLALVIFWALMLPSLWALVNAVHGKTKWDIAAEQILLGSYLPSAATMPWPFLGIVDAVTKLSIVACVCYLTLFVMLRSTSHREAS